MSAGGKPDGSIKISIEGDAKSLEEAIKKFEKQTDTSGKKAKTSIGSVNAETNTLKNSLGILKTAGEKSFSALETAGKKAFNGIKSAGNIAMETITATVTAAAGAVSGLAVKSIDLANDLTEVQNVVDSTFGKNADKINTWAQNASKAYGLSELSAKQYNGTLGAMLKSMGITGESMVKMSTDLTGLAGDMASFYNLDSEVAFEKIRSGISGETEPLKQLGINMSVANLEAFALSKGIDKAYDSMTQAEQATLRYQYIMNATKDAQGDFAKTFGDSLANQLRVAKLNLTDLSGTIGKDLLPMAQKYVSMLSGYAEDLKRAYSKDGFNGMIAEGGHIVSELISEIAKQAPKAINFGFSLVDNIIDGITQNSGKLTSTALDIISKLSNGIKKTASNLQPLIGDFANVFVQGVIKYKDVFWTVAFDMVTAIADGLSKNANSITDGVVTLVSHIAKLTSDNLPKLIETASNLIVTVFRKLEQSMPDIGGNLSGIITKICSLLATNIPIVFEAASDLIITVFNMLAQNLPNISSNLAKLFTKICDLVVKNLPLIFNTASDLIISIFEMLAQNMPDIAKNLTKMITKICDLLAKNLPLIIEAASEFLEAFIEELLGHADEIFNGIKNIISSLFDSFGKLTPKVKTIAKILAGMLALKGVSAFLRTIDNIKGAISGLFGLVKNHPIGAAISLGGTLIGILTDIFADVPDCADEVSGLTDKEQELLDKVDEVNEAYEDFKEAKEDAISESDAEWNYYERLWDELQGIVDQNGNIKKGYENRVDYIINQLNPNLDLELEREGKLLKNYQDQADAIDDLIVKKKGASLLSALEESHDEAIKKIYGSGEDNVVTDYNNVREVFEKQKKELETALKDYETEITKYKEKHFTVDKSTGVIYTSTNTRVAGDFTDSTGKYYKSLEEFKDKIDKLHKELYEERDNGKESIKEEFDRNKAAYEGYAKTIDDYKKLSEALLTDNANTIGEVTDNILYGYKTAETGTEESLQKQVDTYGKKLSEFQAMTDKTGFTQDMVKKYRDMRQQTRLELLSMEDDLKTSLNKMEKAEQLSYLRKKANAIISSWKTDDSQKGKGEWVEIGQEAFNGIVEGLQQSTESSDKELALVMGRFVQQSRDALGIHSPSKVTEEKIGKPMGEGTLVGNIKAISSGAKDVEKAIKNSLIDTIASKRFSLSPATILSAQQTARNIEARAASSVTTTNIHNITTNNAYSEQQNAEGYIEECKISFERGINDLVEFLAPRIETKLRRRGKKAVKSIG